MNKEYIFVVHKSISYLALEKIADLVKAIDNDYYNPDIDKLIYLLFTELRALLNLKLDIYSLCQNFYIDKNFIVFSELKNIYKIEFDKPFIFQYIPKYLCKEGETNV